MTKSQNPTVKHIVFVHFWEYPNVTGKDKRVSLFFGNVMEHTKRNFMEHIFAIPQSSQGHWNMIRLFYFPFYHYSSCAHQHALITWISGGKNDKNIVLKYISWNTGRNKRAVKDMKDGLRSLSTCYTRVGENIEKKYAIHQLIKSWWCLFCTTLSDVGKITTYPVT